MEFTLKRILEIVDESKDLSSNDRTKIAYSMPITVCSLYVAHMKKRHGIDVYV